MDPYVVLNELARDVPIGSQGLVVLDYFQGNRSPDTDPLARGLISGLSLSHGPGHLFRAILEGVCYGTEHIFRILRGHDFEPRSIVVAGGPAKSELWMQMHADISNVPISFTRETGIYPDIQSAAEHMVHTERTIEPDKERHEEYAFYMDRYTELYPQVKGVMHQTTRHVAGSAERNVGDGHD